MNGRTITLGGDPVDLGAVVARTRHAFHADDRGGLVGGDTTFGVRVADGEVSIHPEDRRGTAPSVGAALHLRTLSIGRSSTAPTPAHYALRTDTGAIEAAITARITEQLHNTDAGVEQSWTFDDAPRGKGDLVVRVAASGEDFVATTDTGLHFRDASSRLGVAMSHARWIDADGKAVDLPVTYNAGTITISVPSAVVDNAAYPATLDPTVNAEYDVDNPIIGPTYDDQSPVSVAYSGVTGYDYLVVWQDRRRTTESDLTYDVFGAHVDRLGNVREPVGFLLNDPTIVQSGHSDGNQTDPHVVWLPLPQKFLVVWVTDAGPKRLVYRDVPATSTLPDPPTKELPANTYCGGGYEQTQPDLAAYPNGKDDIVIMAWRENPVGGSTGLICQQLFTGDASGVLADYNGVAVLVDEIGSGHDAANPVVATVAGLSPRFITAFQHQDTFGTYQIEYTTYQWGTGLTATRSASGASTGHPALNPSVATWGGSTAPFNGWLIAYETNNGTTLLHPDYNIYGVSVPATGGIPTSYTHISHAEANQRMPSVAGFGPLGRQVFVGWTDSRSIAPSARGTRVNIDASGFVSIADGSADPATSPTGGYIPAGSGVSMGGQAGNGIAVVSNRSNGYFAVWPDSGNVSFGDIVGANIPYSTPTNGTVGNFLISQSANKEEAPAVAHCGSTYLVAWTDTRNGASTGKDIYGSLLDANGAVLVQNIAISRASGDQQHAAIACLGSASRFFVVWDDMRNGNDLDIYGTPVDLSGNVLNSAGIAIAATTPGLEAHPAIAGGLVGASTPGFAIAYDDTYYIRVTMVDANGTAAGGPYLITQKGTQNGINPDIDFDGSNYVVVWQSFINGPFDIYFARLSPSGTAGIPHAVAAEPAEERYPRIKFDAGSTTATVVYETDQNHATTGVDIYAARIQSGGALLAVNPVANTPDDEYSPRIALRDGSGSGSGSLHEVVYSRIPQAAAFNFDILGQTLNAGLATGSASYAISNSTEAREMTPSIACSAICVAVYRWFSKTDGINDIDRVKARVINGY